MHLPFRALQLVPSHGCFRPSCLHLVFDESPVVSVPVVDSVGTEYAFDVQLTQGFYLLVLSYMALRFLRDLAPKAGNRGS